MAEIAIDWASAEVSDGRLTVAFTEKPPKDWTERLEAVIDRLAQHGSGFESIEIAKKKLRVTTRPSPTPSAPSPNPETAGRA